MSSHPYENLREETGAASLQSAPREEEGCLVSLSMPCEAMSSIISVVNDHLAFENSSQKGGDDVATRSLENRARTLPIPELVSDSEDDPADDNVSSDTHATALRAPSRNETEGVGAVDPNVLARHKNAACLPRC